METEKIKTLLLQKDSETLLIKLISMVNIKLSKYGNFDEILKSGRIHVLFQSL